MSVEALTIALHHSRARGTARLVLVGIANHDGDGGAWPSVATLATYAAVTPRNVQKAIRDLEELGEIRVHYRAGGSLKTPVHERPNLYEITLRCPDECDRTKGHRTATVARSVRHPLSEATGAPLSEATPGPLSGATGAPLSEATPEPSLEPSLEPPSLSLASDGTLPLDVVTPDGATESASTKSTRTLDEQFADLWAAYPRKVGKQAARKVWDRARRTTDPAVILDGARRFAAASRATEARFIPHPSTWLARGGWEDELDAVQPAADARGAGAWAFMQGQPPRPPGSSVWDREPTRARPAPRLTDAEIRDRALNPALYDTRSA